MPENIFSTLPVTGIAHQRNSNITLQECAPRGIANENGIKEVLPEFWQRYGEGMSIAFKFKTTKTIGFQSILSLTSSDISLTVGVFLGPDGVLIDAKQSDEIVSSTILEFDSFNDLKWYNVAIVVSNSSKFHLFIDGIKVVSKFGDTLPIFDKNIFWDSNYVAYAGHGLEQHSIHNITIDDFVGEVKDVYIWTRILDQLDIEKLCDGVAFANASSKLHVSYNPSVPFLDAVIHRKKYYKNFLYIVTVIKYKRCF